MMGMTRRRFLRYGVGAGAALALPWAARTPLATAAPGGKLTKYLEPVPLPGAGIVVATPSGTNQYSFTQTEIARQLHPQLPPTPLWAYDDGSGLDGQAGSFGMAVVAQSGTPLDVELHARPAGDVPGLDPGRHAADPARRPGAADDAPARRLRRGRQRRQPGGDAERVRPRRDADRPSTRTSTPQMPASLLWFHDHGLGRHPAERVRRAGRRLHPPRRARHRRRAEPDRHPRRRLRDPARHPGPPVQPGRDVPVSDAATSRARPGSASTSAT